MSRRYTLLYILLLTALMQTTAQTPVANRMKALEAHLPKTAQVVGRYSDNRIHTLYFLQGNRLYAYDVLNDRNREVNFSTTGYSHILRADLSPDARYIMVVTDRRGLTTNYLDDGQELWRIDALTRRSEKMADGCRIIRHSKDYVATKATRCLNPTAPKERQRWMVCDHYYELNGKVIYAKEEYLWRGGKTQPKPLVEEKKTVVKKPSKSTSKKKKRSKRRHKRRR